MVRHMSNSLSMAKIKTKPASGIPAWVRTITSITIPALGTAAVPIEASGNKGGKQTKLQASTGHKVLAKYFKRRQGNKHLQKARYKPLTQRDGVYIPQRDKGTQRQRIRARQVITH